MMVFESFGNLKIHLPASFWQLVNQGGLQRPMVKGNGYSFLSLELQTAADVAFYLRDTERYVHQIRCTCEVLLADYPVLLAIVGKVTRDAGQSATLQAHRISMKFQLAFGLLLAMGCTLNRILRIYNKEVAQFVTTHHLFCDDTIVLAENLEKYRPSTSAFMPVVLMCASAASTDGYRVDEIEKWLVSYQDDHVTDNYTELGRSVREAYEGIEEQYWTKVGEVEEERRDGGFSPWKESFNPRDEGCTIL